MLDIGVQEILVIMVLALIVFGPDKLPDLGRRLGRAMREFRRASDEFRSTVEQNLQLNLDTDITSPPPASSEPTAATATTAAVSASDGHGAAADGHGAEASPVAHGEHHGSGDGRRPGRGRAARAVLDQPGWAALPSPRVRLACPGARVRADPADGPIGWARPGPQALPGV